ncbi:hypothetical protein FA95DRAFT_1563758 [Auriscalpium vulgare]|uniref:Uncharacterized protein n=1 Tax=Auriscalpium vulgare TaxID=40419 RepID=A0ACB8RHE7_9AGAM|nr:hypothetical protein FA95DRAFT_1563758 [Auriscalpium vulgare]
MPVQKGDVLVVPDHTRDGQTRVTIKWSQNYSQHSRDYILFLADNKTQNTEGVLLFIDAEWFYHGHFRRIAHRTDLNTYEVTIDDTFQYGQKKYDGEQRFVVLHDKARTPHQDRFLETSLASEAAGQAIRVAASMGYGSVAEALNNVGKSVFGMDLHTF